MASEDCLLHATTIEKLPLRGHQIVGCLRSRARQIKKTTQGLQDPDISVVIRTRNNIRFMDSLLTDIKAQNFSGKLDILLVDTESTDGTVEIAKKHAVRVINIRQQDFNYPRALNIGYEAAQYAYVASISGHSNLSNRYMFKSLTYWLRQPHFGGIYSTPLPNWNASGAERWATALVAGRFKMSEVVRKPHMGFLSANCSIISKKAWQALGGYDERYAQGGEDTALGRMMLAHGYTVAHEPLMAVLHSHGLGVWNNFKQLLHWRDVYKHPLPFDEGSLLQRRPDLRQ